MIIEKGSLRDENYSACLFLEFAFTIGVQQISLRALFALDHYFNIFTTTFCNGIIKGQGDNCVSYEVNVDEIYSYKFMKWAYQSKKDCAI